MRNKGELVSLQRSFADLIRRPLESDDKLMDDPRIEPMIEPNHRLSARERLELYSRQYWWRIRDSFDEDFSTLKSVLGGEKYYEIRDRYLEEYPSISFTLRNLGARLPSFLEGIELDDNALKTRAIEAATYDWAKIVAFDAAEFARLTAANIQSRNFSRRILTLQPFVVPVRLSFELPAAEDCGEVPMNNQESVGATQDFGSGKSSDSTVRLRDETRFLILHRQNEKLFLKPSSRNEHFLLSSFIKGSSLINVFSIIAGGIDVSEGEIDSFFESWVRMGWLYCENLR